MPFLGEIMSLLCAIVWAIAIILFRVAGQKVPALELNAFKNIVAALLLTFTWLALFFSDPSTHGDSFTTKEIIILIVSGLVGISLADTLLLKSLALIGAGRNAIISCLFSPFVISLSFLFLGERIALFQLLGFSLVIVSTFIVTSQKAGMNTSRKNLIKGSIYGVLDVLFIAIGMIMSKSIIEGHSPFAFAAIRTGAGFFGIVLWIVLIGRTKESIKIFKGNLPWVSMFSSAIMGSYLALILWTVGFKYTNASTASVLNQTSVLFTLIFAAIFLKEKLSLHKLIGALLGFAGVTFLFLF